MGCGTAREKLENEMIMMKLQRIGIQMERQNQIKLLENIDGRKIRVPNIPDYLDSKFKIKSIIKNTSNNKIRRRVFNSKKKFNIKKRSKSVHLRKKMKTQETNLIDDQKGGKKSKKNTSKF